MNDEFIGLLIQQPWFWIAVDSLIVALLLIFGFTAQDEQDRRLEEMEKTRQANLKRRLGDEEQILRDVHDGYEPPKRVRRTRKTQGGI